METVDEAYEKIAQCILAALEEHWDGAAVLDTKILGGNCSSMSVMQYIANNQKSLALPFKAVFDSNEACLFLRDSLLKDTGDRIWGLTFTLHPDGKFKIDYDYTKPADYEDTEETVG